MSFFRCISLASGLVDIIICVIIDKNEYFSYCPFRNPRYSYSNRSFDIHTKKQPLPAGEKPFSAFGINLLWACVVRTLYGNNCK